MGDPVLDGRRELGIGQGRGAKGATIHPHPRNCSPIPIVPDFHFSNSDFGWAPGVDDNRTLIVQCLWPVNLSRRKQRKFDTISVSNTIPRKCILTPFVIVSQRNTTLSNMSKYEVQMANTVSILAIYTQSDQVAES